MKPLLTFRRSVACHRASQRVVILKSAVSIVSIRHRTVAHASLDEAKELTKKIVGAEDWRDILPLLQDNAVVVNLRHLTTAFYFMTKSNMIGAHQEGFIGDLCWIADQIVHSKEEWSSASLANVLQACSRLSKIPEATKFDALQSFALDQLVSGLSAPISNAEYLTILSCLVHVSDSRRKVLATKVMEDALISPKNGPVHLRSRGPHGFHPRDLGQLSWALTEVKCCEETAQVIYEHCISTVGVQELHESAISLVCRMISSRGSRGTVEKNLWLMVDSLQYKETLARLSSLRDSSMLLLGISRMLKNVCENQAKVEESMSFGVKWTSAVVLYRKTHPRIDRTVRLLCKHISRALDASQKSSIEGETLKQSVYSSILYSLALLQHPILEIIEACLNGLKQERQKLTLRTIATSMWSLAILRYEDMEAFHIFAGRIISGRLIRFPSNPGTAKSIGMLFYSFAVLNLADDKKMKRLLDVLMNCADRSLKQLSPEALPVFGWSIVLAHTNAGSTDSMVFKDTVRAWRKALVESFADIPPQGGPMIHHTEIALSLEAPDLGLASDVPFESLMNLLYRSGKIRRDILREWNIQSQSNNVDSISLFQKQVFRAAEGIHPGWEMEYWDERLQYPVDMAIPNKKIALEVDGPTHFMSNVDKPLGATALKRRLLEKLGWQLLVVPFYEWSIDGSDEDHCEYLQGKFQGFFESASTQGSDSGDSGSKSLPSQMESQPAISFEQVRSNASKLDSIRALKGKMSLTDVLKREALRNNKIS